MKRATIAAVILLCSSTLAAPSGGSEPQSLTYSLDSRIAGCPVLMQARQRPFDHLLVARNRQKSATFAQRISLTLSGKQIVLGEVRVHGFTAKGRVVQSTESPEPPSGNVTRGLTLTFSADSGKSVSADLILPGFTAITSIELVSLEYSDGSEWHVSMQRPCAVTPDPLMLISNR